MLEDDRLISALYRWTSDDRHKAAKAARMTASVHKQITAEESRFSGLLLDLAERHANITLLLSNGRSHSGSLESLGVDFCVIRPPDRSAIAIAFRAIATVRINESYRSLGIPSSRKITGKITLANLLSELTIDRVRIRFGIQGLQEILAGEIVACGEDVVTVSQGNPPQHTHYISINQMTEVSLPD